MKKMIAFLLIRHLGWTVMDNALALKLIEKGFP